MSHEWITVKVWSFNRTEVLNVIYWANNSCVFTMYVFFRLLSPRVTFDFSGWQYYCHTRTIIWWILREKNNNKDKNKEQVVVSEVRIYEIVIYILPRSKWLILRDKCLTPTESVPMIGTVLCEWKMFNLIISSNVHCCIIDRQTSLCKLIVIPWTQFGGV